MKQFSKRLTALLMALTLMLGLFPVMGFAAEKNEEPEAEAVNYGYVRTPHAGTHATTDAYLRGEGEKVNYFNPSEPAKDLPATYDSRDYHYVTSVKNQNPYGSCWAHAAMGSVESYMIKHKVPVGDGAEATTSLNLSETQHCFFTYTNAYDPEGMLTGDKSTCQDTCLDQGGNGELSAYTLMRWTGAADESNSALSYSNASTVNYSGLNSQYAYGSNICHVQNTVWIPAENVEAVKQAIMEYGAGNISYYESGNAYSYICTIDRTSQDNSNHKWANHAITLIGWDDSIAASKFSPNKPTKSGAWICKNSWGTGNFDNGYCYISYEDTSVLEGYIYFYDAEPIDNYEHNYQYDGSCNPVCYGKGWSNSIGYYEGFANNTKVANVFTANGAETLEAIAFCNWDEDLDYTVEIFKNPEANNPSSGTLVATKSGNYPFSGYYTVKLDAPVTLSAGETFSVVITQSVPVADDNGAYVHTPYDATFNNSDVVSWCSWMHADHGATSFYQEPNSAWKDCPENGDYRIKAYTNDIHFNVEAVANNPEWGTLTVNGTKIIAEPAEGYYVAGYEVVSGTATATIQINVVNVTPSSDCVIRVLFAPKPTYTVTYVASGALDSQQTAQIYDVITLPTSVGLNLDDWTFSGWTETRVLEETTDKPVLYLPGADYMVMGDTTLYAVFTRVEGSTELVYECLVNEPEDWEGNYVITYGTSTNLMALKAIAGGSRYEQANNGSTISYASTGMSLIDGYLHNAADGFVWQIEAADGGYTIRSKDNATYLGCSGSYLTSIASYTASKCTWTLAYDLYNGATRATNTEGGASTTYMYLSYSGYGAYFVMNNENGFKNAPPQFWKETTLSTTYYWTDPIVGEHDHVLNRVEAKAATCTEEGNTEYWRCAICGRRYSDANGENEIDANSVIIPALGHDYSDVVTAPTCTEAGYTTHTCSRCSNSYTDTPVDPLGHDWSDWTETSAPTCTNAGEKTRSCSRCNTVETEVIEALGHDVVNHDAKAPTCTESGWDAYETCARCDYTTYAEKPALGHDIVNHEAKEPTCTEIGWDAYETCSRCDYTTYAEKPALGHEYNAVVTEPSCTEKGYTTYTCSRCNDSYTDSETEALGHAWDEGVVTVEPKYLTPGEKTFTCTRCGETRTEEIARLANPFEDVHDEDFFFNPVLWALDETVTGGIDETHFAPAQTVMRADAMVFFWAANKRPEFTSTDKTFKDVKKKHWAYDAVMWAVENGITGGTDAAGNYFSPQRTCTRSEVLQFLYAAMGKPEYTIENPYSDVKTKHWYYDGAIWAYEKGLEKGENGKFKAKTPCTRGYVVTYLYRYMTGNELAE